MAEALAADYPNRGLYREMALLAAARLGESVSPGRLVQTVPPREQGNHLATAARLEAIRGNVDLAISHLADAFALGITGTPWLHATAHDDFRPLADDARFQRLMRGDGGP